MSVENLEGNADDTLTVEVVGLRVEGLHESEFGHVDPTGDDEVPFDDLKHRIRQTLYAQRTFPNAGRTTSTDMEAAIHVG